jgi:hypothetical protein
VSPRTRAVVIEAAITIGTGMALWALMQYGPTAVDAAVSAWKGWSNPPAPPPMFQLDELAVAEFRATLAGPVTDKLAAENWGW